MVKAKPTTTAPATRPGRFLLAEISSAYVLTGLQTGIKLTSMTNNQPAYTVHSHVYVREGGMFSNLDGQGTGHVLEVTQTADSREFLYRVERRDGSEILVDRYKLSPGGRQRQCPTCAAISAQWAAQRA